MKIKIVKTKFEKTKNINVFKLVPTNAEESDFDLEEGFDVFTAEFINDENYGITIEIIQ